MNIVLLPEILRQKLGDDGAKELVDIINASIKNAREHFTETSAEKIERRITETRADLEKQIAETKADLIKWMFLFWVGQVAVMVGVMSFFYNLIVHSK
ncbi:Protein of unknown function [Desulfofundulus australicus DSM 11792]|uniref:Uncharacterized protein n=1 Tax=Desulfofundulus australicus DSM 11792 TaxID=1121425 RepID=A0A1M4XRF4_9FIRM|nr:DUF1640 domain-containing protein [Desulfofundulus australicus]SHE96038.1 Protein of unknown function [Desulfofundulus australicus DSM 11792]